MFIKAGKFKKIQKYLKLDKPLVIFDLETTGPSVSTDKIIQLAYIKIWPDGRAKEDFMFFNPEIEIPRIASELCGVTDKNVAHEPKFKERAQELWDIFNNCYYGGFNVMNFDLMVLRREFIRVGIDFDYKTSQIIDSRVIFRFMVPRNLSSGYKYFCNKEFQVEKNALSNIEASAEILLKQLERYSEFDNLDFINHMHQDFGEEVSDNSRKVYWKNGKVYLSFSKYKDKPLFEVAQEDPEFLKWMLEENFTKEIKAIVREVLHKNKKK